MKKRIKFIVIPAISLVCVLLVCIVLLYTPITTSNSALIKTKNLKITYDMMSYLIDEQIDNYVDYHTKNIGKNYLDTVKLDLNKSLKNQDSVYGTSWFDYFYNLAFDEAEKIILSCEKAKELNISLNKDEESEIEKTVKNFKTKDFKITENSLKCILQYKKLADKYELYFRSNLSEEDYEKYYNENRIQFDCVDYKYVTVYVDLEGDSGTEKTIEELTTIASKKADKLLDDILSNGFDVPVKKYLKEIGSDTSIEDLTVRSKRCEEGTQFSSWALESERKSGDAIIFAGKYQFTIYYLEKAPYPYDYTLREGRIVYGNYDSTNPRFLTELKTQLTEAQNKDAFDEFVSEKGFSELELSSYYMEDLPEPVYEWFYSADRKSGDCDVCSYGKNAYVMLYSGDGDSYFKNHLENLCADYKYDLELEKLSNEISIKKSETLKFLILR